MGIFFFLCGMEIKNLNRKKVEARHSLTLFRRKNTTEGRSGCAWHISFKTQKKVWEANKCLENGIHN